MITYERQSPTALHKYHYCCIIYLKIFKTSTHISQFASHKRFSIIIISIDIQCVDTSYKRIIALHMYAYAAYGMLKAPEYRYLQIFLALYLPSNWRNK